MTPSAVLAGIPNDLLRGRTGPNQQAHAQALARWLLDRGHRPSLLEVEQERARRATDAA
jgi:hypothetical protein